MIPPRMIPYGRQEITQDDIDAVTEVLKSDFLTQGPKIAEFEEKFARLCDVKYAVVVNSCTAALHLACLALDLKQGDTAWTSPNTFVATSNGALYCGGNVDFIDIDPQTWNMSVSALEEKLLEAEEAGTLPKIVLPVHFAGQSCDMEAIHNLSKRYGFKIVEDAAHCIGASYKGKPVGTCAYSDIAVFSLHPVKIITSGEGGMITTNSKGIYEKLLRLRTHGITKDPALMEEKDGGAWYFEQQELGYHYRITDIQAALGISQMDRLDQYIARRRELVARYQSKLAGLSLQLPVSIPEADSSWHIYVVMLKPEVTKTRREVFDAMREAGIGVNVHYIPVYSHPYYKELGFKAEDYPENERYYASAITLPLYPALTESEQDYICDTLAGILNS